MQVQRLIDRGFELFAGARKLHVEAPDLGELPPASPVEAAGLRGRVACVGLLPAVLDRDRGRADLFFLQRLAGSLERGADACSGLESVQAQEVEW